MNIDDDEYLYDWTEAKDTGSPLPIGSDLVLDLIERPACQKRAAEGHAVARPIARRALSPVPSITLR
jgi:hypothetical protein